jgi:hypothetical protein
MPVEEANSKGAGPSGSSLPSQELRMSSHASLAANDRRVSVARGYLDNVCTGLKELEHIIIRIQIVLGPVNAAGLSLMPKTVKTPKPAVYTQPKGDSLGREVVHAQSRMGEYSVCLGPQSTLSHTMGNKTSTNCFQAFLESDTLRKMLLGNKVLDISICQSMVA